MPRIEWGILIVNYLFLGGLSAGIFFVSALATYLREKDEAYARIARYGALIAPWPVTLGCLLLIFDLGKWTRFYKLFLTLRWQSPMSIGSWLLLLFTAVALVNLWAWLPAEIRGLVVKRLRLPAAADCDLSDWRRPLAAAGFPLSIGVAIYTGVLLGAVQARPFWNTNLVAQMFLFSALSTGCAALILALSFNRKRLDATQLGFLYTLDICLITLECFIVLPYILHGELSVEAVRTSLKLILGGPYTVVFWVLFMGMGLVAPLAVEVWEVAPAIANGAPLRHSRRIAAVTAALVIGGGYLLRYLFVYAGQMSSFGQ
jgi:polysulfide reductase chain C